MTTHVLSNEEVIEALQSDAVSIHKQQIFLLNNLSDPPTISEALALNDYSYILGTIEQQINNLFI